MQEVQRYAGKTGLLAAVAHALSQHALCRTHVVWIKCGEIEIETLGKAKAHLLPLVLRSTSSQDLSVRLIRFFRLAPSVKIAASECGTSSQPTAHSTIVCAGCHRLLVPTESLSWSGCR